MMPDRGRTEGLNGRPRLARIISSASLSSTTMAVARPTAQASARPVRPARSGAASGQRAEQQRDLARERHEVRRGRDRRARPAGSRPATARPARRAVPPPIEARPAPPTLPGSSRPSSRAQTSPERASGRRPASQARVASAAPPFGPEPAHPLALGDVEAVAAEPGQTLDRMRAPPRSPPAGIRATAPAIGAERPAKHLGLEALDVELAKRGRPWRAIRASRVLSATSQRSGQSTRAKPGLRPDLAASSFRTAWSRSACAG